MTDNANLDLATAERMLIEAGAERQAAALKFYTEGIRNMMLGVVAPNFERALDQILKTHIDTLSRRLDNSDRARLRRNTEFQLELDNRLDALGDKQDTMLSELKAVSDNMGKIGTEVETLKAGQTAIVNRISEVDENARERYEKNAERIDILETGFAAYVAENKRAEVEAIKEWIAKLAVAVEAIQSYLDPEMTPEKAREQQQRYIEMLERHEVLYQRLTAERGDAK